MCVMYSLECYSLTPHFEKWLLIKRTAMKCTWFALNLFEHHFVNAFDVCPIFIAMNSALLRVQKLSVFMRVPMLSLLSLLHPFSFLPFTATCIVSHAFIAHFHCFLHFHWVWVFSSLSLLFHIFFLLRGTTRTGPVPFSFATIEDRNGEAG